MPGPADQVPAANATFQSVSPQELRRQADELAQLAQRIPAAVDQVSAGKFPKDLNDNLRRIEKLPKNCGMNSRGK
jgi:hypothetical protein